MIALLENGQWNRVTLRELRKRFPNVSFRKTIENEGQSWEVDEITYEAVVVTVTERPDVTTDETSSEGPLIDNGFGGPETSWIVSPTPLEIASDYTLNAVQFHTMIENIGKDQEICQAINVAYTGSDLNHARNKLERGQTFVRNDPLVVNLALAVGLTPDDVDTLWLQATGY